jgi:tripartite-type tricarboxylate transporter receptor subunit TctC
LTGAAPALAQAYPNRPVKLIVPYPAGGAGDIVARLIGQHLNKIWGQPVVIDNRTGGSGVIGAEAAARSEADGYTLFLTAPETLTVLPHLFAKLPFDGRKDFAPISLVGSMNMVLVVHPTLPASNVQELIALAKQKPGELSYASTGVGSYPHLNAEMFKTLAKVDLMQVPYKGGQQGMTAVLAGEASIFFVGESTAAPLVEAGKLKALGTTADRPSSLLRQVQPISKQGLPDFVQDVWFGLFAPTGTPDEIVKKIAADCAAAAKDPELRQAMAKAGVESVANTPKEFAALIDKDAVRFANLIQTIGIKPQ